MKVTVLVAGTEKGLQKKMDAFFDAIGNAEIIDMQFSIGYGALGVLIRYKRMM